MAVRVAFCITELDPGGAERALVEIVTQLDPAAWEVRVYCLGPETELSRNLRARGIPTECLGARRASDFGVLFRLAKMLRDFRPAVLQTFLFHANIVGRLAGWWSGVPVILSGLRVAERSKRWYLWLDRWTNRLVTQNVCVSEGVRSFTRSEGGLPDAKLYVIPNGVDVERFSNATPQDLSRFGIPAGAWTLVTVGRLSHQKGHDDLVRAVSPLLLDNPRMHLLIVGEGHEREALARLVESLGVGRQVHLPGWEADIPGILKSCQAFALPSRWEGMPNALLEAMASGLPCVATDVEGVRELLGRGKSGNLVSSGDVPALRLAVKRVYDQGPQKGVCESQSHILEWYTWNAISQRYSQLFTECLDRSPELHL